MISSEVWRFSKILPGIKGTSPGPEAQLYSNTTNKWQSLADYEGYCTWKMVFKSGASLCYTWVEIDGETYITLTDENKQLTNKVIFKIKQ